LNSKYGRQLQAALDTQVALQEIPGATLFVSDPDKGEWSLASGNAVLDPETAMNPTDRFRIGSTTKTFTASAILRLVDEGMLELDDPVEQYLPELEIPKDDIITIRHLLNHTSGLAGYTHTLPRVYQPEELVQSGIEQAPDLLFEPGTGWLYTNTNYIVLGMIIESVTGSSYAAEIRQHFIEPLGLANTFVPEDESIPGNHAHSYLDINGDGELDDVTYFNPSIAWSAGNMISTAEDLAHWTRALYGGKVLSKASLAEMLDFSDNRYGLGVIYDELLGVGHGGGIGGYNSIMVFNPDTGVTLCVLINKSSSHIPSIAHEALDILERLSWTTFFDRLHARISNSYAFTDWKGIDWDALYSKFRERIAEAEAGKDRTAYITALREYAFSIPDGHVALDPLTEDAFNILHEAAMEQIGGSYGLALTTLDDRRTVAHIITDDGPAALAGMEFGAEILEWNGEPVKNALQQVPVIWATAPPATNETRELEQLRFLGRAPVGTQVTVTFKNPNSDESSITLTAVDDQFETYDLTDFFPTEEDMATPVQYEVLPSGYGYIKVTYEGVSEQDTQEIKSQYTQAVQSLVASDVPGIILDLRRNGGGNDSVAAFMAGFFYTEKAFYEYQTLYNG
ncbi:MAG: serine hydrolase, partial [Desulfobacterales bacterium]|nr:serine hydrolase [Desulfobacterales bacterium]